MFLLSYKTHQQLRLARFTYQPTEILLYYFMLITVKVPGQHSLPFITIINRHLISTLSTPCTTNQSTRWNDSWFMIQDINKSNLALTKSLRSKGCQENLTLLKPLLLNSCLGSLMIIFIIGRHIKVFHLYHKFNKFTICRKINSLKFCRFIIIVIDHRL